jgi:hypothetical protein
MARYLFQKGNQINKGRPSHRKGQRSSGIGQKFCAECFALFEKDPDSSNALWLKRRFCSKSCALKGNKRTLGMFRGEANPSWKGGITPINALIRSSTPMVDWRKAVFKRDDYTCQGCNERGGKLHAHHIKAFSAYPELRFEISNGQTLCYSCHRKTDNYAGKGIHR